MLELLEALGDVVDQDTAEPEFAPARPGEVSHSCLDVARARRELGWSAQVELRDRLQRILSAPIV